jgi:hypothetical protein
MAVDDIFELSLSLSGPEFLIIYNMKSVLLIGSAIIYIYICKKNHWDQLLCKTMFFKSALITVTIFMPNKDAIFLVRKSQYTLGSQTGSQDKVKPCQNCSQ